MFKDLNAVCFKKLDDKMQLIMLLHSPTVYSQTRHLVVFTLNQNNIFSLQKTFLLTNIEISSEIFSSLHVMFVYNVIRGIK